jgi:allantoin racemase
MRILYQTLGVSRASRSGAYGQLLQRIVQQAAAPGTAIDVIGLSPHRAVADQYRYLEFMDTTEVIDNGLRAELEGYDAMLIGNIFQPGLHQLRELLNIPVLGLNEASVSMACLMAPTYSIINVNPKFNRPILDAIRLQGLEGRLVSVEMMTVERPGMFDVALNTPDVRQQILDQFAAVSRRALDKGAEVLIPAGGSLMGLLIDSCVAEIDGAPVLNGIAALVKTGEMAVEMRRITGTFTSKRLTYAPPSGKLLADVRAAYGEALYPGAK